MTNKEQHMYDSIYQCRVILGKLYEDFQRLTDINSLSSSEFTSTVMYVFRDRIDILENVMSEYKDDKGDAYYLYSKIAGIQGLMSNALSAIDYSYDSEDLDPRQIRNKLRLMQVILDQLEITLDWFLIIKTL